MMASRPSCPLSCPSQADLDALARAGVTVMALIRPEPMQIARGHMAHDALFESHPSGDRWYAFPVSAADDIVFWQKETGKIAIWTGRAFALGEEIIWDASTYSFDCALNIFSDPLDWLRARRDGIVVLDWYLRFRSAPRCPTDRCHRRHLATLPTPHEAIAHAPTARHSIREARSMNHSVAIPEAEYERQRAPKPHFVRTSTTEIMAIEFEPIRWVVKDYVPEGLTILAGRQKLGKTWLAMDWAIAVACGGFAMGSIACEQGDVLYIDLGKRPPTHPEPHQHTVPWRAQSPRSISTGLGQ